MKQRARTVIAACALLALLCPPASRAAEEISPPSSFKLANGLEVIIIPNHRVPAVSHMMWYRVGAADDPPGKSGIAHFHEHMMYQGTAKYKAGEYADIISRHGGQENAFTGYDATAYFVNISKDKLGLAMELEADRMRGIKPQKEKALKEREVIIEERRARIENNPESLLSEQMNAALFRNHPYHLPVIGWMHEMKGLAVSDVLDFHRTWYHPNNAFLIVSGDVTEGEVRLLAEKHYGGLPEANVPPRVWNEEPPQNSARRITMHHQNVKQPSWRRRYAASGLGFGRKDLTLPLHVLSYLLGESKTSRLYRSLVAEQKIATGVDTGYDGFALGPSQFSFVVTPEQGTDLTKLEQALDKELDKLLKEGVSDAELKRAKTQLKAQSIYARDGLQSMANIMGELRINSLPINYFSRWPALIEAVTAEQVLQAAKDTFKPTQSVTAILLPEKTP